MLTTRPQVTAASGRHLGALLIWLLPTAACLWAASHGLGGRTWPWQPALPDLAVFRAGAQATYSHHSPYDISGLPFVYPPIAALLFWPLTLASWPLTTVAWTLLTTLALAASLRLMGLSNITAAASVTVTAWLFTPIRQTFEFGQVGLLLLFCCLAATLPRPTPTSPRRAWVQALLLGLATAVKLTPALFIVYLAASRRPREAARATAVAVALWAVGWLALPTASKTYWGGLLQGNAGLGDSIIYLWNQSLWGATTRFAGTTTAVKLTCLGACLVIGIVAVTLARVWFADGYPLLATTTIGLATLLMSPVSWVHHFVWALPLAVAVYQPLPPRLRGRRAPILRGLVAALLIWLTWCPFQRLPSGGDIELTYSTGADTLAAVTSALCLALIGVSCARGRTSTTAHQPRQKPQAIATTSPAPAHTA